MFQRVQLPVYSPVSAATIAAAAGGMVTDGGRRSALSQRLCAEYRCSDVLLVDSGTSALAHALAYAAEQRAGLPAALPAYSCWDLATAAAAANVSVILYDVDPVTLTPDRASLKRALEHGVSSVVVVHLYGMPVRVDDLRADIAAAGAVFIEDAAQAFGAFVARERVGVAGDMTVLSFGRGKGLSGGSGGALLARTFRMASDERPVSRAGFGLRDLTVLTAQWLLGRPALYSVPASIPRLALGETVYHEPRPARRMSDVAVRAVMANWPLAEEEVVQRRQHAEQLLDSLGPAFQCLHTDPQARPGYLRLPVLANTARVCAPDARSLGIIAGYPLSLADLPQLQPLLRATGNSFNGARELARRLITVPVHSKLTRHDLDQLARFLSEAHHAISPELNTNHAA